MTIEYYEAPDVQRLIQSIIAELDFKHIDPKYVYCFRSRGSKSRRTIARIHSLEKLWQLALNLHARYLIEVIEERYDRLSQADKEKVLIHELLHIPKGFSGGFRSHKTYISNKSINELHERYKVNIANAFESLAERF
ncbi:MAG: putative metallopeptidase [Candidatus Bathyarchaeota archaeon]|nr:putative metallopeptidase [Candidatus Bathyarchaeota archaeon]